MRIGTLVRKLVVNTGLAAASFLIAILLLEIGARVFSPDSAPATVSLASFYRYDELLGWAQVPDQRGRLRARDFNVSVVTDSSGLRDNETTVERAAGRHRMLVLGDSYGWGWGVERSDRFSEILETRLSGWEVINASVPGYSTDQQLLYLQQLGLRYEPDVVLLLFYGNDHRGNLSDTQYGYNKPFFTLENESLVAHNIPVPPDSMLQRAGRYIYAQTFVIGRLADFAATAGRSGYRSLARAAAGGFGGSTGEAPGGPPGAEYAAVGADGDGPGGVSEGGVQGSEPVIEPHDENQITRALIRRMNELVRSHAGVLLVVSVPHRSLSEQQRRASARFHRFLDSEGIVNARLEERFAAATEPTTFAHDQHWNPLGHRIAAQAIADLMMHQGLVITAHSGIPATAAEQNRLEPPLCRLLCSIHPLIPSRAIVSNHPVVSSHHRVGAPALRTWPMRNGGFRGRRPRRSKSCAWLGAQRTEKT